MSTTAIPSPLHPERTASLRARARGLVRGGIEDPAWARPALIVLLACTALAYLVNLTASGQANSFYAAAVQAATKSWKAFFFGSLDSSNFITVDKPPASLWVMALSGRLFGFTSFTMLAPQALEGVVAVGMLHCAVKRWFGAGAGLLAGVLLAITPVAALMFRFNNPDALLVCLLVASAYCVVRALEHASTRWLLAVGTLIGVAFLAKMMQAFLVVPGFALAYLVAGPTGIRRRIKQLVAGGFAIVVSGGWWVAIVALWPAASRPLIDGSPDNSILNLITGYNGFARLSGGSGPGGAGGGPHFSGASGPLRLFNDLMGGQASWLLPAAIFTLLIGLWWTRRRPRTDRTRAGLLLWGGWLIGTAAVFSFASGVIHTYYAVALAPAIAALVAIGASMLWRERARLIARLSLGTGLVLTAAWSWLLLGRTPSWQPWLRPLVLVSAALALFALLAPPVRRLGHSAAAGAAVLAMVAMLAGPVAYSVQTIATAHTGSTPSAGPSTGSGGFGGHGSALGFGGPQRGTTGQGPGSRTLPTALITALDSDTARFRWVAATSGSQSAASIELASGGKPVMAIGGFNNQGGNISLARFEQYVSHGAIHYYVLPGGGAPGGGAPPRDGGAPGGAGGPGPSRAGPAFLRGGLPPGGPPAGAQGLRSSTTDQAITSWVEGHFKRETFGGQAIYDLTQRV